MITHKTSELPKASSRSWSFDKVDIDIPVLEPPRDMTRGSVNVCMARSFS